jgi:hypothetical protein
MTVHISPLSGRLAPYRVLEIGPWYADRDGRSLDHATPRNSSGAQLVITFGDFPESLMQDLSNAVPLLDGGEAVQQVMHHRELPELDRDTADLSLVQPGFVKSGATYLTIGYVRAAVIDGAPGPLGVLGRRRQECARPAQRLRR